MIISILGATFLAYFALIQITYFAVSLISLRALRRERIITRYGRVEDMLDSDLTPPVSIIVPAYNEEAGIVEAVRSMIMLHYPRFEVVVVNDGSTDATLDVLVKEFGLVEVTAPFRRELVTEPVRRIFRSELSVPVVVVDKVNGGKADALNAGTDVARFPYLMFTDADIVLDPECLLRAMRHVVEDRDRTVAVGGNVRPINGCTLRRGRVVETHVPGRLLERMQVIEYLRSFVAARPGWSRLNCLPLISGAFGIFRRDLVTEIGGFRKGHLGEDLDLTMRLHRHLRERRIPYRIVHAPDAVAWTEVPSTRSVLRRQRLRWHRGLVMTMRDHWRMILNPRYGTIGMVGWPVFFLFEFTAPVVELAGWVVLPVAAALGLIDVGMAVPLLILALALGAINSFLALLMDDVYAYFTDPLDALRVAWLSFGEHLGLRQQTALWRVEALFHGNRPPVWGDMSRRGVGNVER